MANDIRFRKGSRKVTAGLTHASVSASSRVLWIGSIIWSAVVAGTSFERTSPCGPPERTPTLRVAAAAYFVAGLDAGAKAITLCRKHASNTVSRLIDVDMMQSE
jgi:hypothetical protein